MLRRVPISSNFFHLPLIAKGCAKDKVASNCLHSIRKFEKTPWHVINQAINKLIKYKGFVRTCNFHISKRLFTSIVICNLLVVINQIIASKIISLNLIRNIEVDLFNFSIKRYWNNISNIFFPASDLWIMHVPGKERIWNLKKLNFKEERIESPNQPRP